MIKLPDGYLVIESPEELKSRPGHKAIIDERDIIRFAGNGDPYGVIHHEGDFTNFPQFYEPVDNGGSVPDLWRCSKEDVLDALNKHILYYEKFLRQVDAMPDSPVVKESLTEDAEQTTMSKEDFLKKAEELYGSLDYRDMTPEQQLEFACAFKLLVPASQKTRATGQSLNWDVFALSYDIGNQDTPEGVVRFVNNYIKKHPEIIDRIRGKYLSQTTLDLYGNEPGEGLVDKAEL